MRDVIWYSDEWYAILWDKNENKKVKYRLIKVGKKYIIQKWFTFTKTNWNAPERVTNYSDITDLLDYETAIAKMNILQWRYKVVEEFSA